ncbi:MAG: cation diffusion facilitator family transporter [Bacteroidales bacterium]|jgi:cation diffusion facilitator family transporter|nr:cation diffusion facilitator family transporter [Bacteroidales bacterium]
MVKEKKNVALSSVIAAVFLTGFKFVVGILTGSLGILSEAIHSLLDLLAAIVTYFSVRLSDKPADKKHNFGHGKVENLSALIQTVLLLVVCFWIFYEGISRLVTGDFHIEVTIWSYFVIATSIVIDFSRSRALSRVAKKYNSQALEADALHFSTDIWSSTAVLVGLICVDIFDFPYADPIAALVVAVVVLYVCYKLGKKSIDILLDRAPEQSVKFIEAILNEHNEIQQYHNLRVRNSGADTFITFNIHIHPKTTFVEAHHFCDHLEKDIAEKIPRSIVFIHVEPQEEEDRR